MPAPSDSTLDARLERREIMGKAARVITQALKALPDDEDAIAEIFRERGYTGKHGAWDCPVAKYLSAALKDAGLHDQVWASVGSRVINACPRTVKATDIDEAWSLTWQGYDPRAPQDSPYVMPQAVIRFINRFDNMAYLFLDQTYLEAVDKMPVAV